MDYNKQLDTILDSKVDMLGKLTIIETMRSKDREQCMQVITTVKLRHKSITFILSILFGMIGLDRIYLGDIKLAIGKALTFAVSVTMLILLFGWVSDSIGTADNFVQLGFLAFGGVLLFGFVGTVAIGTIVTWTIADIILCGKRVREKNASKILKALDEI